MTRTHTALLAASLFVLTFVTVRVVGQARDNGADAVRLSKALEIKPGLTVAEIGAGEGALTIALAREVGSNGRVYSSELGDNRVRTLQQAVEKANLPQIAVITGDPLKTNLPDACCDAIFMRIVYHHFGDPAAMNASLFRALKPAGRLAVIDFMPRRGEADKADGRDEGDHHGVLPDTVVRELKQAGFEIVSTEPPNDRDFMVVARRPS